MTRFNEIFARTEYCEETPSGTAWEQMPGEMAMVSTAEEKVAWGLDSDGHVWLLETGKITFEPHVDNEKEGWSLIITDVNENPFYGHAK